MDVGQISPVFLSPFGFHLIKLTDRKPAAARPFEEVRAEVEQRFRDSARDQRTKSLIEQLKKTAIIEDIEEASASVR